MLKPSCEIVLITGATSGIGKATAELFAKKGYAVIISGRRADRLESLHHKLTKEYGVDCLPLVCDVRHRKSIETAYHTLPEKWKAVDILVNNAGLALGLDKLEASDLNDIDQMIDTNLKGLIYMIHQFLPRMIERNKGHIVNIGSIAGHGVYAKGIVYCSTKYGVNAITAGLRHELFGTSVRVSQVSPGMVETEFSQIRFKDDAEKANLIYKGLKPLLPEDIADIILYITQAPLHVNINEVVVMPLAQAGVGMVFKSE